MQNEKFIKNNSLFLLTLLMAGAVFILLVKDLFFFDEDIFLVNLQSAFLQQDWERSFLVKQFFKAEHFFFGKNPAGYHIVSVLFHLSNSILAVFVFKHLLGSSKITLGRFNQQLILYIFLLLFLTSPVHSEPLTYILAQGILIFTFFALLSVLFFLKALTEGGAALFLSLLFFALSLLCYEISWMIPLIVFCIAAVHAKTNRMPVTQGFKKAIPFFIVLLFWFAVKAVFISGTLVADYGNVTLQNLDIIKTGRNSFVLFVRNFSPPFQSTTYFIVTAITVSIVLAVVLYQLFKRQRAVFSFALLLILLLVLSFLPTALFGIDSHDSESERYVYFSSVFAMMLLALLLATMLKNGSLHIAAVAVICLMFAGILYKTIGNYRLGGNFSKLYLNEINNYSNGVKTVYTINQPSQYKGALLLRALTRLPERSGDNYTVLNEYMLYLHGNSKTAFITISAKEIKNTAVFKTVQLPLESTVAYFAEASQLLNKPGFVKESTMIAAVRNDSLYIFR